MSSKLFPYKMKKGQWFRAEDVTDSDIAVIVDTTRDTIFFWEGARSSARSRSNARDLLGQLKKKYIPYKFQRVTNNSPEEILFKIEDLKAQSFTGRIPGVKFELKDFNKIFYILNIVSAVLAVISMVLIWQAPFWTETSTGLAHVHYSIDYNIHLLYVNLNSLLLLVAFLIIACTSFAGHVLKKKAYSTNTLVAMCFLFIAFFLMRIWDNIMYYEVVGNNLLFRKDVMLLFLLSMEVIIIPGMILSFLMGFNGLKELSKEEESEETEETK